MRPKLFLLNRSWCSDILTVLYYLLTGCGPDQKTHQSMQRFKTFLERKQIHMENINDLVPYFALPYIPDPWNHSIYKHLFDGSWSTTLKKHVLELVESLPVEPVIPKLYQVIDNHRNQCKVRNFVEA